LNLRPKHPERVSLARRASAPKWRVYTSQRLSTRLREISGDFRRLSEPFPADERLQDAGRQYHLGNFARAVDLGLGMGGPGAVPAAFATTIYAQYIEQDDKRKIELFKRAMAMCKEAEAGGLSTPKPTGEIPRLCRGGSNSLTFQGVHQRNVQARAAKHTRGSSAMDEEVV